MHLLLARSQRDDGWLWSDMTFLLDARLDLSLEAHELFKRYQLRSLVVYDSDARVQHMHSATVKYDAATKPLPRIPWEPSIQDLTAAYGAIAGSLWNISIGAAHELLGMMSLRITLGSLVDGQHIESGDLPELLIVERNIREAVEYLADYLQIALSFDGSEDLHEYP